MWRWKRSWVLRLSVIGLPALVAVAAVILWLDPVSVDDRPVVDRVMKVVAASARADFVADMEARGRSLRRLARLGRIPGMPRSEWDGAARVYLSHHPGYHSLVLLDPDGGEQRSVRGTRPEVSTAEARAARERVVEVVRAHWNEDAPALATVRLAGTKRACLLAVPSVVEDRLAGFLLAELDLELALDHLFADHADLGYSIAIHERKDEIYRTSEESAATRGVWSQTAPLRISNVDWRVEAWPEPDLVRALRSRVPELSAVVALMLLLLLASTAHFARTTHLRERELHTAHDELESRVALRTSELHTANERLRGEVEERTRMGDELRRMSARLLHLQDDERQRIARELHDSTGQILSTVRMNLSRLRGLLHGRADDSERGSKMRAIVEDSERLSTQALSEVRTISYLLHPPNLDELGLPSALRWYVAGFSERSGIDVRLEAPEDAPRLPAALELGLFRVVQEALGNVHRHSSSRTAEVRLVRDAAQVRLTVADRGRGFSAGNGAPEDGRPAGVGIVSMRERVREQGGTLTIRSSPEGTVVEAVVPLPAAREPAAS